MILLNTQFTVSDDFDRKAFFGLISDWLSSKSFDKEAFDNFKNFDFGTDECNLSTADELFKCVVSNYDDVFIFSHTISDQNTRTTTNYVLDDKSERRQLHVDCDRSYLKPDSCDETELFVLLELLQRILWNEFGGADQSLVYANTPCMLRKTDGDMVKKILTGETKTSSPVVYISSHIDSASYDWDYVRMASELGGYAHVLVESSPVVSEHVAGLMKMSDKNKPYNGALGIYSEGSIISDSDDEFFIGTDECNTDYIINFIRNRQLHVVIDDKFDAAKIRQKHVLSKIGVDSELGQLFESMLADKQQEIEMLKSELADSRKSLSDSRSKISVLEDQLSRKATVNADDATVSFKITEKDLYDGEIQSVILKILQRDLDSIKDDANLGKSRRFDILSDILDHNFPCTTGADLVRCLRDASKDGNISREGIGRLQSSGFTVVKGGDHYKIYIGDETRYFVTLSSTPSDKKRGYLNMISDFTTRLFG